MSHSVRLGWTPSSTSKTASTSFAKNESLTAKLRQAAWIVNIDPNAAALRAVIVVAELGECGGEDDRVGGEGEAEKKSEQHGGAVRPRGWKMAFGVQGSNVRLRTGPRLEEVEIVDRV